MTEMVWPARWRLLTKSRTYGEDVVLGGPSSFVTWGDIQQSLTALRVLVDGYQNMHCFRVSRTTTMRSQNGKYCGFLEASGQIKYDFSSAAGVLLFH
jgi:hypothetical protein